MESNLYARYFMGSSGATAVRSAFVGAFPEQRSKYWFSPVGLISREFHPFESMDRPLYVRGAYQQRVTLLASVIFNGNGIFFAAHISMSPSSFGLSEVSDWLFRLECVLIFSFKSRFSESKRTTIMTTMICFTVRQPWSHRYVNTRAET